MFPDLSEQNKIDTTGKVYREACTADLSLCKLLQTINFVTRFQNYRDIKSKLLKRDLVRGWYLFGKHYLADNKLFWHISDSDLKNYRWLAKQL